jgi:pilus assembly protein CpaE
MSTILICDTDPGIARAVASAAADIDDTKVMQFEALSDAVSHLVLDSAQVLFVGPSCPAERAFEAARAVRESGCSGTVLLMVQALGSDLLREAMRAGVSDVLDWQAPSREIEASLREAIALSRRQPLAAEPDAGTRADIITVFSTKGGVGKTVVSTNIAVALAQQGCSVVLVDLDLQFGDVGIMLGLEPTRTIMGAVQSAERLDAAMLEGFLVDHSSGLKVLLAPTHPEDAEMVTASRIDRILRLLATQYDYVVVDTPPSLDEAVLTALDRSTRVIAITMMDIASIKNSRISLQKLKQLGYNGSLVEVLLNRADSKVYLSPENVEEAIGAPIKYRLPSDAVVPRAVNKGLPVVTESPRSQPAKVLMATAKGIIATREEAKSHVA